MALLLFCGPVMSDSLQPHGLQHTRPPCPSPSPGICPRSCSLNWRCSPAISSSDALFSFCSQSFPASGTLSVSHLFASDGQNIRTQHSASVYPMNIQGWSPLRLTSLISLLSKGLQEPSPAPQFESINSLAFCLLYDPVLTNIRDHWEVHTLTIWNFFSKVMYLLFNTPSRFVITFLPSSHPLISWLQSPSTVILESKRISVTASTFSPSICHAVMGLDAMILAFVFVF